MIRPIVKDIFFLGQKSEDATKQDMSIGQDIEVEYLDSNWKKHRQKYSGWTAQIIQHECDHFAGIII